MREALYYEAGHDGAVGCRLCPKGCEIKAAQSGACRVRRNDGGRLYSLNYGQCSACALDPLEKKPLYHFSPGQKVLSLGTFGCNMSCRYCQNWTLSQQEPATKYLSPQDAVALALRYRERGNIGLAYTYSEPTVWYEYVWDTAQAAREEGLKNVVVTNGFINQEPLKRWLEVIDAINIDVKAFNKEFYRKICGAELTPVLKCVEMAARRCHVEITTLLVPGHNDDLAEVESLARWLAGINPDIPLHLTRYHPDYQFTAPETPLSMLSAAQEAARTHLHYVYIGNVAGEEKNSCCPHCGAVLLERFAGDMSAEVGQECLQCGAKIQFTGPYL
ncbi:AmmeMemoRadiSam system radical SAM enzyme [Azotosporobacter soli]|uniref:AmmeMemoRadiSam system radical SAM enzyme n=1 Tax=Azotosporobacter soli TaxID=3055040 RepID=UPI0031FE5AF2